MQYQVIAGGQLASLETDSYAKALETAEALVAAGVLGVTIEAVPQSPLVSPWAVWPL